MSYKRELFLKTQWRTEFDDMEPYLMKKKIVTNCQVKLWGLNCMHAIIDLKRVCKVKNKDINDGCV